MPREESLFVQGLRVGQGQEGKLQDADGNVNQQRRKLMPMGKGYGYKMKPVKKKKPVKKIKKGMKK